MCESDSELKQRKRETHKGKERRRVGGGLDWRVRGRGNRYVSAMTHRCLVFIASGGREVCGGGGARGQTVWEAARTASLHRRQGVVEGQTETAEIKHEERKGGGKGKERGVIGGTKQRRRLENRQSGEEEGGEDE